jgi:segregation and condensation protein B
MDLTSKSQDELDKSENIKNLKKLEAALFISGRFLSIQELISLTDINPILLRELIEQLQEKYNNDESAIEILEQGNKWKMDVKQEYRDIVNRLATGSAEFSKAEQETLAVIAYKQPVKQSVIVKIRGNKAYDHIKNFINMSLLNYKKLGHTKELRLSEDFYDYFNIQKGKNPIKRNSEETAQDDNEDVIKEDMKKQEKSIKESIDGNENI